MSPDVNFASDAHPERPPQKLSAFRAWLYLIRFSIVRQARIREMTFIALGLLGLSVILVGIFSATKIWDLGGRGYRSFRREGVINWRQLTVALDATIARTAGPGMAPVVAMEEAMLTACRVAMDNSEFYVFSNNVVFPIVVGFLLPIWSLSFATQAMAGEREGSSLVWLLTRPQYRGAIYLGKYIAQLPWSLGLCMGGFALICLAAGKPGRLALQLYWPAIFWGTLAFSALFFFIGSYFRRPAIVSLVYAFFFEIWVSNMPGFLKRASVSFYVRCIMFDAGKDYAVNSESPWAYLPVDGGTASMILGLATIGLLLLGMGLFSRLEYASVE